MRFSGRRAIVFALLLSSFVAGSLSAAAPAQAANSSEKHMMYLINQAREHYGRAGLRMDSTLSYRARRHSEAMADKFTIFHTKNLASVGTGLSWHVLGENVGMGPTIVSLHQAFMASAPHRANNLYRGFRRVGVGVVNRNGILFITVEFLG